MADLKRYPWRMIRERITGLLTIPPVVTFAPDGKQLTVPATRLGLALNPPDGG